MCIFLLFSSELKALQFALPRACGVNFHADVALEKSYVDLTSV